MILLFHLDTWTVDEMSEEFFSVCYVEIKALICNIDSFLNHFCLRWDTREEYDRTDIVILKTNDNIDVEEWYGITALSL